MKIIAHRGASGEFPENSLLAFEQAIIQQADGIELDAQYHQASGEFVLLHDSYVKDKAGNEFHFNELPLADLLSITKKNQPITTLDKALTNINGRCLVNIELKTSVDDAYDINVIVQALVKLLNKYTQNRQFTYSQFIISAFNHPLLIAIKRFIPEVKTAALIAHHPLNFDEFKQILQAHSVNPSIECLNKKLLNDAHQLGLSIWVYTVDRTQDIQQCLALGVDAIFTNYPARTKLIVENKQNLKN
jgi:glycerophosphoryl diester phosphodiesterase